MSEHPLAGYTAEQKTVTNRPKDICEVHSMKPVPEEMCLRESLGPLTFKGSDPEAAAKRYREIKHLPADWPVEVVVKSGGRDLSHHILPEPQ